MNNRSDRKNGKTNVRGRARRRHKRTRRKKSFLAAAFMILFAVLAAALALILLWVVPAHKSSKVEETENRETAEDGGRQQIATDNALQESYGDMENGQSAEQNSGKDEMVLTDSLRELIQQQTDMIEENSEEKQITVSVMGDSISTFRGYIPEGYYDYFPDNGAVQDVTETWWEPLFRELGLVRYANASSSGSTCTGDSASQDSPQYGCDDLRINDLAGTGGEAPDIIIVYMGTNDLLESIPLGTNDGTKKVAEGNVQNFSDAYTLILDKLLKKYPDAQIYCCTITQIGTWGTDTPFVEFVNGAGDGLTAVDYNECIAEIAGNKGIPVIDLYDCGIALDNLQETTSDGVHPTPLGMQYIRERVRERLIADIL